MSLISLARKLSLKHADEIPSTLRSGDPAFEPTEPIMPIAKEAPIDLNNIPSPKLDGNERMTHQLSPGTNHLLKTLDLMFHAGIVTPIYYQHMRRHLYTTQDITAAFQDFVSVVEDAEKELATYSKRLNTVKELLHN